MLTYLPPSSKKDDTNDSLGSHHSGGEATPSPPSSPSSISEGPESPPHSPSYSDASDHAPSTEVNSKHDSTNVPGSRRRFMSMPRISQTGQKTEPPKHTVSFEEEWNNYTNTTFPEYNSYTPLSTSKSGPPRVSQPVVPPQMYSMMATPPHTGVEQSVGNTTLPYWNFRSPTERVAGKRKIDQLCSPQQSYPKAPKIPKLQNESNQSPSVYKLPPNVGNTYLPVDSMIPPPNIVPRDATNTPRENQSFSIDVYPNPELVENVSWDYFEYPEQSLPQFVEPGAGI
eukprot:TRINITY_DN1536_c0_g1_i1.p1 TRINITY_DN1536_c0_g1~~TRINITY_DN1536_c0_g1_i1.p1  ORF type:complete len:284 (-),score=51.48 TRINITY_DN1536_c0_g1_i1:94-945(-)